jgi:aminocarboxymuconate-semialdehyde decarboxylase
VREDPPTAGQDGRGRAFDVHAHALPLPFLRTLAAWGLADLAGLDAGVVSFDPALSGLAPGATVPLPVEHYDLVARSAAMDEAGVDGQAVSAPPFVFGSCADDPELVLEVTRRSNDALAGFVAASGGRLVGLGTVPVGIPGAAAELHRCLEELGLAGATVGTFGGGRELDDPVNEEIWTALARAQRFVLLHPSRTSSPARVADHHLAQLVGYPAETALATARLILGGVLDRHDLVLCLAHGGGCVRAVGGRLDLGWCRKPVARTSVHPPSHYLRRLRYDTAAFDPAVLRRLVDDVGAGNVLLGTDFPFDLSDRDPRETVRRLDLDGPDEHAVLGGTAARLLRGLGAVADSPAEDAPPAAERSPS